MMAGRTPTDSDCSIEREADRFGRGESRLKPGSDFETNEITALLADMRTGFAQTQESLRQDAPALEIVARLAELGDLGHRAGLLVLKRHLRGCIMDPGRHHEQSDDELLAELHGAVERFVRSLH
jgi:hypothetical protein